MIHLYTILLSFSFLFSGCLSIPMQTKFASPKEYLYYKGNRYYEIKDFEKAIEYYKKFLDQIPNSNLATAGKLNLGMSYYYLKDYKNAYDTLSEIELKDENIKKHVQQAIHLCQGQLGEVIEKEKIAKAKQKIRKGHIRISVLDAYIDSRDLVILGKTDKPATITINGKPTTPQKNNTFKSEISWKKGKAVSIQAEDQNNNAGELNFFPDREPPEEPEGLQMLNTTTNSIEVRWDENDEKDLLGYKVFYLLKGGKIHEEKEIIEDEKYEVVGLSNFVVGANRTFQFFVRAVDRMHNESDDSDILEVVLP